jgi:hypothetical protein
VFEADHTGRREGSGRNARHARRGAEATFGSVNATSATMISSAALNVPA